MYVCRYIGNRNKSLASDHSLCLCDFAACIVIIKICKLWLPIVHTRI